MSFRIVIKSLIVLVLISSAATIAGCGGQPAPEPTVAPTEAPSPTPTQAAQPESTEAETGEQDQEVNSSASAVDASLQQATPVAAGGTIMRMTQPELAQTENGNSLEIWVYEADNFYAIDLEIRFDPERLQVADADPELDGVQIQAGQAPSPDFVAANDANNQEGVIRYVVTQLGTNPGFDGSGVVATIIWEGEGDPQTDASFGSVTLVNQEALPINITLED